MGDVRLKEAYTTGEVARICRVSIHTVITWIDTGGLRGWRIPGTGARWKHRRVNHNDLVAFMTRHNMAKDLLPKGDSGGQ